MPETITVASLVHTSLWTGRNIIVGTNDGSPALTHGVDAESFRQWHAERIDEGAEVAALVCEHGAKATEPAPIEEPGPVAAEHQPEPASIVEE